MSVPSRTTALPFLLALLASTGLAAAGRAKAAGLPLNSSPPSSTVKLVFVHHSVGENWLADDNGQLGVALRNANYFVSDTNYGWGPVDIDEGSGTIGDHTDIGNYWRWFSGPNRATYLSALFAQSGQSASYSRLAADPGGVNRIVMFKSCFPNSQLYGSPSDPIPPISSNPLRGEPAGSENHTLANAKGIYIDLLSYFATKPDTLFVLITQPPLISADTDPAAAANARALTDWLQSEWLASYTHNNVFVFNFFRVLTSNGGSTRTNDPATNDLGWADGNHHRFQSGAVEHTRTVENNMSAYWTGDSHPSTAGNLKATGEFVPLLNIAYHCWVGDGGCPTSGATPGTVLTIDNRFQVTLSWSTTQGGGASGQAQAISTAPLGITSGGLFWFFSANNPEVLVKVLNGCAQNGNFWAFASAGTNVGFTLTFTDTQTGRVKTYTNPDVTAALPVQDTSAFPCP